MHRVDNGDIAMLLAYSGHKVLVICWRI